AVEHVVERRDPVRRDEQQVTLVDAVQLADLATGQVLVVGQSGTHRDSVTVAVPPGLCWDRTMKSRLIPYANTPVRLLAQLFSDAVVVIWSFIWVLVGLAVHSAVSTIAGVGRQVQGGADGV